MIDRRLLSTYDMKKTIPSNQAVKARILYWRERNEN
jgi:hypothetical protein